MSKALEAAIIAAAASAFKPGTWEHLPRQTQVDEIDTVAEDYSNMIRAAITAYLTALATDGWKLVPVEPLPEMLGAWYGVKNGHHFHDEPPPTDKSDYAAYRAMLAAAPSALIEEQKT